MTDDHVLIANANGSFKYPKKAYNLLANCSIHTNTCTKILALMIRVHSMPVLENRFKRMGSMHLHKDHPNHASQKFYLR